MTDYTAEIEKLKYDPKDYPELEEWVPLTNGLIRVEDLHALILRAQAETADWAVHVVDEIENSETRASFEEWKEFKNIRGTLRERFRAAYGVDPSPTYNPKRARLQALPDYRGDSNKSNKEEV